MVNRRALLLGISVAALMAIIAGPAEAQWWRFLRGRNKGGGDSPRPTCPPHLWVLYGNDPKTGRYVMKCMRCGLFKIS